jgi:hypothetical protein
VDDHPDPAPGGVDIEPVLDDVERWFVLRGLPHFVERTTDAPILDAWTRALPLLVVAYLLLGFNALDLENWTVGQNVAAGAAVIAMLIAAWAISNRLRGVATFARPTDIDAPELALFLLAPAIPILVFEQVGDAIESVVLGVILLALIYVWASYGIGALLRWGLQRGRSQLTGLGSLVARALPLLLLFNTFLFVNAEVWEMAGTLYGIAYVIVLSTFGLLGVVFALSRVPGLIRSMRSFESWSDIEQHLSGTPAAGAALPSGDLVDDPLTLRQRFNIGLIVLFGQALQITLVTVALTAFFVLFGFFAVSEVTASGWTRVEDIHVFTTATLGGRPLVLSEPLLRVSAFLGAFSGMYFTVVLTTDETYRTEFADDVGPQVREALAVRRAYRIERGTHPPS